VQSKKRKGVYAGAVLYYVMITLQERRRDVAVNDVQCRDQPNDVQEAKGKKKTKRRQPSLEGGKNKKQEN
jgi:hypothetical protein